MRKIRETALALGFAVAVWAFCGAIMDVGPLVITPGATLVVHAIGGPLGAAAATLLYCRVSGGFPLSSPILLVHV